MHSWRDFGNPVGADDPVRPRKNPFFTEIPGKFATFQRRTEASAPTKWFDTQSKSADRQAPRPKAGARFLAGETDGGLADVVDSPVRIVCKHEHIADASEHCRIRNEQRACCDGGCTTAGELCIRAVAGCRLHDGRVVPKRRPARMQCLPEQALELCIRLLLRCRHGDGKCDRCEGTHRHCVCRKRRAGGAAAVRRADRNRIVKLAADLQIVACTRLDAHKLARKRPCEVIIRGRSCVRAV